MGNAGRIALAVGAAVVALVLFLVFRAGADDAGEATPTVETQVENAVEETTATGGTTTPPASPPPPPEPQRIRIDVPAGGPTAVRRVEIDRGERVVLMIRSAIADHVHVHGYDLLADVAPGRTARITFTADVPGRFEIELEDRGEPIAELRVTP